MKKILVFIFSSFILITNILAETATSSPSVLYDNFNVTEPNHAKLSISLKTLDNSNITITGNDASKIKKGKYNNWYYDGVSAIGEAIYYAGKLNFGTGTGTTKNSIDAEIQMRWPNAATLYDGTKADVLMTISDIEFNVKKLGNTSLSENGTYYVLIALSSDDSSFWFYSQVPQTRVLTNEKYEDLTETQQNALTSKSYSGNSYKVNIKLLKHGTNTPIDSKYESLAFGMKDIDITDKTVDTSSLTTDSQKILAQGNGRYNEGVEFINGFDSTVHFASETPLDGFNITEQSIVKTITGPHGGVKVMVDPAKKANDTIRPNHADENTYYSGFITMASPQNLTFYWTGVGCGSELFSIQDVRIDEKHNEDGTVSTKSYGSDVALNQLNKWETTLHAIGSTPTYSYDPKPGYHVVSLKIDGEEAEPASNYKYTFDALTYKPLFRLGDDAMPLKDENDDYIYASNPRSIEIVYAKNAFTIVYEDGGGKDGVVKMPDEEGHYEIPITLSANEYDKSEYEFVKWKAYIEDADGNRTPYLDDNGEQIYFSDSENIGEIPVPHNGKLVVEAIWKNKTIVNPATGLVSVFALFVIALAVFGGYRISTKDKLSEI